MRNSNHSILQAFKALVAESKNRKKRQKTELLPMPTIRPSPTRSWQMVDREQNSEHSNLKKMETIVDIETPLLSFVCNHGKTDWTIKSSFSGTLIVGSTGSGKTSSSSKTIAKKFIKNGYGGLVLTVKDDEVDNWKKYCQEEGRLDDLLIIEPNGKYHFNMLDYISKVDTQSNYAQNIFKTLKEVIKANEQRATGRGDDIFWESANDMYLKNIIQLALLGHGKVTLQLLFDISQTAPSKNAKEIDQIDNAFFLAFEAAKANVKSLMEAWDSKQDQNWLNGLTQREYQFAIEAEIVEMRQLKMVKHFFYRSMFDLSEKTRSIINFYFLGFVSSMLEEPIYSLFFQNASNVTPDDCIEGKIILINLPVRKYDKAGQNCQQLFKYIWMKAVERRSLQDNGRPVFLYQDEGQEFVLEYDNKFQSTARSSLVATVLITQSLANMFDAMGGDKSQHKVKSLLGNLGTKIFHSNADTDTNEYASSLIGQGWMEDPSSGTQIGRDVSVSTGRKYMLQRMVRPEEFARLKNGGPENDFKVDAYIHIQNKLFPNGFNHQKVLFTQK